MATHPLVLLIEANSMLGDLAVTDALRSLPTRRPVEAEAEYRDRRCFWAPSRPTMRWGSPHNERIGGKAPALEMRPYGLSSTTRSNESADAIFTRTFRHKDRRQSVAIPLEPSLALNLDGVT